jgi:NAD+ kinase
MIAIYGRNVLPQHVPHVLETLQQLKRVGLPYIVSAHYMRILHDDYGLDVAGDTYEYFDQISDQVTMVFSMGGDGTILESLTFIGQQEIPVLGINFGRLGFLANVGMEQIQHAIEVVAAGKYQIDNRSLIAVSANKPLFPSFPYALNELTLQRKDQSSMITVHTFINGELLNSYWADGLIVSTPTGSTGYSLSCGGPIIYPTSGNFVITPIAPHNLNVRPIIISDEVELSFGVSGRENSFLCTMDSRFERIDSTYNIVVRKAPFSSRIVRLTGTDFISTLRNKLNWGADTRNA